MSELLSAEIELKRALDYSTASDDQLVKTLEYWKDQPQNPERSERSRKLARAIMSRLDFEIRERVKVMSELDELYQLGDPVEASE